MPYKYVISRLKILKREFAYYLSFIFASIENYVFIFLSTVGYYILNTICIDFRNQKSALPAIMRVMFFLTLIVLVVSCKNNNNAIENIEGFTIKGNLQNASKIALFFEELTPSDIIPVDSIYTDENGNFAFDLFIEDASFYRLGTSSDNFITLSIEPSEIIIISADASNMPETYKVKGSPGSALLWELAQYRNRGIKKIDSLRTIFHENQFSDNFSERKEELRKTYRAIKADQKNFTVDIINKNPNSLASILALYQFFDDKVLIKESEHFEQFQMLSKTLCSAYPTNKHVMDLKKRVYDHQRAEDQRLQNEKNLAVGMPAPDITLPDPSGQPVSLSSLKGNVVLIDFWAAWCPPCRKANPSLVEIYNDNRDKGFEIYGVSLDRTRDQWMKAIEADSLTWIQVSDLRFMNSPVVSLYNVQNIPYNILLNREGKIAARNLSTEELAVQIKELL
jgi:peroxiredoxin